MSYRIGVDVGATGIKIGIVDENYRIIGRRSFKTPADFEDAMKQTADAVRGLMADLGLSFEDFPCIGVGVPCSVFPKSGKLVLANNTSWKDVSLTEVLSRYLPLPIYVANDANCAVIGETMAGAAKGKKHILLMTLGTGTGSGIILDGKLFSGGDGVGGEIGHMPLVYDGLLCTCGLKGCLECYASATALIRQTKEAMANHPESMMVDYAREHGEVNGQTAFACAKAGDETALQVVDQYASYVAAGIGGFTNLFRPELVLIGGGVSGAGEFLLERVRSRLSRFIIAYDVVGGPVVEKAALGNDAGIIGAAFLDRM